MYFDKRLIQGQVRTRSTTEKDCSLGNERFQRLGAKAELDAHLLRR